MLRDLEIFSSPPRVFVRVHVHRAVYGRYTPGGEQNKTTLRIYDVLGGGNNKKGRGEGPQPRALRSLGPRPNVFLCVLLYIYQGIYRGTYIK